MIWIIGAVIYALCFAYTAYALVLNFKQKKWLTRGDILNVVIGATFWPVVWVIAFVIIVCNNAFWNEKVCSEDGYDD